MQCPYCDSEDHRVLDTRCRDGQIHRRRECLSLDCKRRFVTVERLAAESLLVRKRNGKVVPFSRRKLVTGLAKAASVHALPPADIDAFANRVVHKLQTLVTAGPVPSTEIGRIVLEELLDSKAVTDIVRIRYAIVFLGQTTRPGSFRDLRDFLVWLQEKYGSRAVSEPAETPWRVIKRSGRVEPFDVVKLARSVRIAIKGRGTDEQVHKHADKIAKEVRGQLRGQALVTAQQVGGEVLKVLRQLDALAYLRFASVMKRYQSVDDFWVEALGLERELAVSQQVLDNPQL